MQYPSFKIYDFTLFHSLSLYSFHTFDIYFKITLHGTVDILNRGETRL